MPSKASIGARSLELIIYVRQDSIRFPLPESGEVSIGRGPRNDVRIDDSSVSRNHVVLRIGPSRIEVEDLGSSNGTTLLRDRREDTSAEETSTGVNRDNQLSARKPISINVGDMLRVGSVLVLLSQHTPSTGLDTLRRHETIKPPSLAPATFGPAVLLDQEMQRLYALATRAAQSDIPILVLGETGVGKEVLAETIHQRSKRQGGPFLRLNCAALSESLLESELFGHEKGAYTGAAGARAGLLESTDGGTVFLDEIGELSMQTQAKLLRVLEERRVLRLGSTKPRSIDVRFITATNRDLDAEIEHGRFRGDLFYRVSGVQLRIPPLRERRAEIAPLAKYFLDRFCARSGIRAPVISDAAIAALESYAWPGNVRQLRNMMEQAPFIAGDGVILPEHVVTTRSVAPAQTLYDLDDDNSEATDLFSPPTLVGSRRLVHAGREEIVAALAQCGGNQTRAAELLGVSRRTLINRMEEYGLPRPKKS
jgi:two-component system response regulator AtoC